MADYGSAQHVKLNGSVVGLVWGEQRVVHSLQGSTSPAANSLFPDVPKLAFFVFDSVSPAVFLIFSCKSGSGFTCGQSERCSYPVDLFVICLNP